MMIVGGSFLTTPIGTEDILTKESLSEEQVDIYHSVKDFLEENIAPHKDKIEKLDIELTRKLITDFSELGFGSIDIEEEYGGMEMDKVTSMVVTEAIAFGQSASWAISFGAHVGIGTLPIAIFGNKEQKAKYLPKLATAEWIGAYCLTEPGSGSDALSAKSTAILSEDGKHYILNGTKQFITNGGFADIFIVFSKINGEDFTGFIVERDFQGVSNGAEEHKLGLKGSSTTTVVLEDVKVPVENLLWKQGKGHQIAFNILNIGRIKLGFGNLGGCKIAIKHAFTYANERKQFGQYLTQFDMIKSKFADMIVKTYTLEAMSYHTAGLIQKNIERIDENDPEYQVKSIESIEDYAIEASMLKVFGSETLGFCTDTGIQILGGYGFTEEYALARMYRDTRVDRIYEGTNEINRQVIAGYYLKNALTEKLPIREYMKAINAGLKSGMFPTVDCNILSEEKTTLELLKMIAIFVFNEAIGRYGQGLKNEQMILEDLANTFMDLFNLESVLQRITQKHEDKMNIAFDLKISRVLCIETVDRVNAWARRIINGVATESEYKKIMSKYNTVRDKLEIKDDVYALKKEIADHLDETKEYPY
jgi:alkylation response protein AidB-like acyl-CoA dehydrogenase